MEKRLKGANAPTEKQLLAIIAAGQREQLKVALAQIESLTSKQEQKRENSTFQERLSAYISSNNTKT